MRRLLLSVSVITVGLFCLVVGAAHAQSIKSGNSASVAAGEKIDSSLWMAGHDIDVAGEVNGDIYCVGQNINISGTVHGDVICAGQTINISGTVDGDIRVAGQTISLNGSVSHNVSVAGQSITSDGKSKVDGDLSLAGRDITLNGSVGRDLLAAGNTLTVHNSIGRNVRARIQNLTLGSNAKVGGNLAYTSNNDASILPGAVVGGQTIKSEPQQRSGNNFGLWHSAAWFAFYLALAMLVMALVLVALFPKVIHDTTNVAITSFWRAFLTGLLAAIIMPFLLVLLFITVVGIPLALLLLFGWLAISLLSGIFSAYYLGRRLWHGQHNPILIMLAGSILLILLYLIPVVDFFAFVVAYWLGVGMILVKLREHMPHKHYDTRKYDDPRQLKPVK